MGARPGTKDFQGSANSMVYDRPLLTVAARSAAQDQA
jgi:hypothetical protein